MESRTSLAAIKTAIEALAASSNELSYPLLYEALDIEEQADKDNVRARITNMVKHGELTRTERGSFIYNPKRKARPGARYAVIWRFVRAAKPCWSIEDCCLMTRASFRHVRRYVDWLENEGFVERAGRNGSNAITYRNTGKARMSPETPFPPVRETDPFARERAAAAAITRLMLCADPYALKTGRQICESCKILLARFEKAENRMENENPRKGDAASLSQQSWQGLRSEEENHVE